jgi:hypothetical protein
MEAVAGMSPALRGRTFLVEVFRILDDFIEIES